MHRGLAYSTLLACLLIFSECDRGCSDAICPTDCVYVPFNFMQDGRNVFEAGIISQQGVKVESLNNKYSIPIEVVIRNNICEVITCKGASYRLYLDDKYVLDIDATIVDNGKILNNECCTLYSQSIVTVNNQVVCSDTEECEGPILYVLQ